MKLAILGLIPLCVGCVSTAGFRTQLEAEYTSKVYEFESKKVYPECGSGENSSYYCGYRIDKTDFKSYQQRNCSDQKLRRKECYEKWTGKIADEWKEVYEFALWDEVLANSKSIKGCDLRCFEDLAMESHNAYIAERISAINDVKDSDINARVAEYERQQYQAIAVGLQAMGDSINSSRQANQYNAYQNSNGSQPSYFSSAYVQPSPMAGPTSYRQIGNAVYDSNGNSWRRIGNTVYGSDGSSYQQIGNAIYGNDGTSYRRIGNVVYGSDGSSATKIGNATYMSNGRSCRQIGNAVYCN